MINVLSKVTSSRLKFLTSRLNEEKFKLDLLLCGLVKPSKGIYVSGVEQLTNAQIEKVTPAEVEINEEPDPGNEKDLEKVGKFIEDYLKKNPKHILVIDSEYKYLDALLYVNHKFQERILVIEYKPIITPAPAWVAIRSGIYS